MVGRRVLGRDRLMPAPLRFMAAAPSITAQASLVAWAAPGGVRRTACV
ncbi:hypothetical protein OG889_04145 [Streptomyces sp. NBC_00481]|nr:MULTISPECIES: hypothetical protein [unclassified Streptomyces]WRY93982.1 hypothetical protein OG889_04145 [Streptomyces sp. NBC_00481]